jgi:hypothetical protein
LSWHLIITYCHEKDLDEERRRGAMSSFTDHYDTKTQHKINNKAIWGGIQNIVDWCRHLYSSCGSVKHQCQQAKLWIPGSTVTFCSDCVKTCKDVVLNFSVNRPGCFTMTTPCLTLLSSPSSFWWKTKWLPSPAHHTPLVWHPVTSSYFQKWNESWKDAGLIPLRRSKLNRRECLTLWQKRTSRKCSKNGGDGTGVYRQDGTTLRVMAADSFMIFTSSVWNILDTPSYSIMEWNI